MRGAPARPPSRRGSACARFPVGREIVCGSVVCRPVAVASRPAGQQSSRGRPGEDLRSLPRGASELEGKSAGRGARRVAKSAAAALSPPLLTARKCVGAKKSSRPENDRF